MLSFVRRSATSWLVNNVDRVSLAQKELRPAFAAVRGPCEIRSRLAAAMDHHDRPCMRLFRRDLELDVQLSAHCAAIVVIRIFPAREEIPLARDRKHFRIFPRPNGDCDSNYKHEYADESFHNRPLYNLNLSMAKERLSKIGGEGIRYGLNPSTGRRRGGGDL